MEQWIVRLTGVCAMYRQVETWFLFLVFAVPLASHAQDLHRISGKVVNQEGEPLMGNVVALSVRDSSFLKGNSFLEGDFELSELNAKEVLVKLTSLEFKDTLFHVVFIEKQPIDLGVIVVNNKSQMLKEVEIVGSAPLFNARPDGVTEVNVANTVLATSNSVMEILARSPNVTSDDNGISIFGKGQAILYLNGKRITQERLASISASQVKSIEIISNPSAIYDAEGRAVINIVTKDDLPDGYRATAQQQASWSDFAGTIASTIFNFNYKKRKIDLAGNYDLKLGNDRELLNTTRARQPENDYLNSAVRWDRQRDYANVSKYSLGASYDLNGKGYASLEYNGSYENVDDQTQNRNHIITTAEDGMYSSHVIRAALIRNNSLTVNVNKVFDSLGSSFFVGGQLSQFRSDLRDRITENNMVNDQETSRLLKSNQNSEITIFNPQADFVKVFTDGRKLGIGAKLSYVRTLSDLRFYRSVGGNEYEPDLQRSNDFEYRETVPAAYIQYDGIFNTMITYGLGLRSEWTNYTLYTTAQDQGTFRSSYVNLFPNAQVNLTLSQQLKLRAAYTSRITRPAYQALSPTLVYQDAFTSMEGNPNLRPEKTHSVELGASLNMFDLKAGYNYTIDPLSGAALRGEDEKSYVLKNLNFRKGYSYFTSLSASVSTRWLNSTNTVSVSYNKMVDDQYGYEQVGEKPQVYAYTSNKINVGNVFTIQVLAWYLGEKYYSLRYEKSRSMVTMGVEKELFNKLLKCSFTANDIFHKTNAAGSYDVGQTFVMYNRFFNTNYYRLTLTCTFGQLKKTLYKSRSTGEAENSRAR
jgi:outer membrane receptor protein involved in Fe transport